MIGLLLPQQYNVNKSIEIQASAAEIKPFISDFSKWQAWSPWEKLDPSIQFRIAKPSAGVGAHQFWQNNWGSGEMTITNISKSAITLTILLNDEHIVSGDIHFKEQGDSVYVSCQLVGEVTTSLIGGYLAAWSQYILNNTVELGLNNLKTIVQLQAANRESQDDSQSNTSQN